VPEKLPDRLLVERAGQGDEGALSTLFERYRSKLEPFALRYFRGKRDARDLAHDALSETFIRAWTNLSSFDPERASFSTWIHTIAQNARRSRYNRGRPQSI
jgi:RNA polymerase sigma-70 factor (ECF subfamily)